ncbi:extra-large guanine nucleotide-binding protein 3-like [Impatiens glandulifera]|uniref:extra-large guanine nucleotide-binding protein 3-like n=1 Tax=Impatiens glandulifera TaxID=253017 RepID=UPI001FB0DDB3|nr:extra-large guanine nucleotide-binding protein 3-like [Impatiens glandulifera]
MSTWEVEAAKRWEEALRRMLPVGAPLPDEEHLDYSIAVEYDGPPVSYTVPRVDPIEFESVSIQTASIVSGSDFPSLVPVAVPISFPNKVPQSSRVRNGGGSVVSQTNDFRTEDLDSRGGREEAEEAEEEDRLGSPTVDPIGNQEGRRAHIVTFDTDRDEEDGEEDGDVSSPRSSVTDSVASPIAVRKRENWLQRRSGTCSRCQRPSRLREREVCIVCDARYCNNCVLKAMGSMPEGRKCVPCIGLPIDESRRSSLGKCSRMLSKVCSTLEVQLIMKAERECPANQLRPEQLFVNGRQLRQEELGEILGCQNPPQKLKPGRYWYDKDSGLWGKEGEKPDRIITSKLNVGGKLRTDSSNGNTKVFINGREITKTELRVLKLAKVQCPRDTHFWVYDDGSYEEEGQNNIKGNIWSKASTRFFSSLLSLPVPPTNPVLPKEDPTAYSGRSLPDHLDHGRTYKVLLTGLEGCGTSTIFKQAKFLYDIKFSTEELHNIKLMIQSNMYKYLSVILEGRERFEDEALEMQKATTVDAENSGPGETSGSKSELCVYSINSRLKHFSDWLLNIMATGDMDAFFPAATREYAPVVDEIWKDTAIQETYKRREELHNLPDVSKYFLDQAVEISSNDYEPSEKDILYAEGVTPSHGLSFIEFSFDDHSPMSEVFNENFESQLPLTRYQLIRLNSKGLLEGCKWLQMFEDVRVIVFCVSLSDYDQMWAPQGTTTVPLQNKLLASRDLFENLVKHPSFGNTLIVLVLNKYDSFEEKVNRVPITVCEWFKDFNPLKPHSNNSQLANQAYYYMAVKFKELYSYLTGGRKLFVWQTKARERASVDEALKYIREVVKWDEGKDDNLMGSGGGDDSIYSTEISSSPYIRQE